MLPVLVAARHGLLIVVLLGGAGASDERTDGAASPPPARASGYVGSAACRECHSRFYELWATSRHARSVRHVDATFASRHLSPQTSPIEVNGASWQVHLRPEGAVLSRVGGSAEYEIGYAVGGANMYFFLTLLKSGRWQVLPLAYDTTAGKWHATTASMLRGHAGASGEPLDWTDPAFTWNAACMQCHVSQPARRYVPETNSYQTSWLEDGINCETCHGPGGRHVEVMRAKESSGESRPMHLVLPRQLSPERRNALCASCHALAARLTTGFRPGDALADHYHLVGLENADFYPDGQSRGETYTYTSFLLSDCVSAGGLTCTHCHTPSGRPRWTGAEADRMCMPCHAAVGNDPAGHTHHAPQSEASRCTACHMREYSFAGGRRSEHSMSPPAPRVSMQLGTPNACNDCHPEQDAAWAEQWVRKWYPRDYEARLLRRARLIDAGRKQQWEYVAEMTQFIADTSRNEIFRASLIRLLGAYSGDEKWPALVGALNDSSVWVRAAAAEGLAMCPRPSVRDALVAAADDAYRAVRMRAAFALSTQSLDGLAADRLAAVRRAFREFEALAARRADEPAWQVNLGIFHQNRGDLARAAAAYEQALAVHPAYQAALVNLSVIYARQGRLPDSERVLLKAARADPDNAAAHFNLGLLYGQMNRLDEAEKAHRRALRIDPRHAGASFNLAVILGEQGRYDEALTYSRNAAALRPDNPRYQEALAYYQSKARSER